MSKILKGFLKFILVFIWGILFATVMVATALFLIVLPFSVFTGVPMSSPPDSEEVTKFFKKQYKKITSI